MNAPATNRPAPLIEDLLNAHFGDIDWAICYPDGSYAIGIRALPALPKAHREMYGRTLAEKRAEVMKGMHFEIIQHGWMKPRGVEAATAVVVFNIVSEARYA